MIAQHRPTVVGTTRHDHSGTMMANIADTISSGKQGCERIRIKLERLQEGKAQPIGCGEEVRVGNKLGHKPRTAPLLRQRMQDLREELDQIRKTCEERVSEAARSKEQQYSFDSVGSEHQIDDLFADDFCFDELEKALFELNLALNEDENPASEPNFKDDASRNDTIVSEKSPLEQTPSLLESKFEVTAHPKKPFPVNQDALAVQQPSGSPLFLSWYLDADNKWCCIGAFLGIVFFDWHGVLLVLFGCLWTGGLCLQHIKTT